MRYHVTLTTQSGRKLTAEVKGSETAASTIRWILRLRAAGITDPVIPWVTVEGERWCLEPAELVGDIEVIALQPVEAAAS